MNKFSSFSETKMDESKVEEMFAELDGLLAGKPVKPEVPFLFT